MRGEELRSVRLELGVTQKRMSELLGTSVRNVQAWESEQNRITGPTATAVQLLEDVQGTEIGENTEFNFDLRGWFCRLQC